MPSRWEATAGPRPGYAAPADEVQADFAIIGAGYTGLSAALHIAADGRRAVVLEADTVGWGASGRPLAPIPLHAFTVPAVKLVTSCYQLLDGLGR